jgi:protein SCO1/2
VNGPLSDIYKGSGPKKQEVDGMRRMKWDGAAFTAVLLIAVGFLTFVSTPAVAETHWGANYFPNVTLTTQDGKKVHFYDDLLKGKTVVIELIYTHCVDACPLETARLAQIQKMLGDRVGKDIFFYSITIDPVRDTPKVMKAYAAQYHAGPGWLFLTGKKEDIDLVSKKMGLYSDPEENGRDGHSPAILLGNEPSHQWIRNSATDNPRFISNMITNWLTTWKDTKVLSASESYDQAPKIDISNRGRYFFGTHCAACHTIGHGDKIGPDLQGVASVRDHAWLARFISTPDQMLKEKDPVATALFVKYKKVIMPNLSLQPDDLEDLIKFLETQSVPSDKATAVEPPKSSAVRTESAQPMQQQ